MAGASLQTTFSCSALLPAAWLAGQEQGEAEEPASGMHGVLMLERGGWSSVVLLE